MDENMEITTTYLEMLAPDEHRLAKAPERALRIEEARVPQWQYNRFLYALVGSQWEWRDKQSWTDAQWAEYAQSPALHTFVGYVEGTPAGYFELQQQAEANVELAYFGLAPTFIGRGLGGALLSAAIGEAWKMSPRRVWVHTCTLDHPNALKNYQARGFSIYKTESAVRAG
jgi:GNAT superfamily N-acetyltransferase